ncbi:hypothetical protein CCACVL1_30432 [Corchorus capsularis]|uniref:Uncharacterized protein n=1 Tax=Corchorus capsularis TaxID=210143 RepID=A0A1R3FX71_COCAP|nr:hypothetical protein CCACVL1_30432 [Corchorus capsularis]
MAVVFEGFSNRWVLLSWLLQAAKLKST